MFLVFLSFAFEYLASQIARGITCELAQIDVITEDATNYLSIITFCENFSFILIKLIIEIRLHKLIIS